MNEQTLRAHETGIADCRVCWPNFPVKCEAQGCKGWVHAEFFEQSWYGPELTYRCDGCGNTRDPELA